MNRDRLVAAVVDASAFASFEAWSAQEQRRTLAAAFEELRGICAEEGYVLETGAREDRANRFADALADPSL